MNDSITYFLFFVIIVFFAYKKYSQYKVLKLVPSLLERNAQIIDVRTNGEFSIANKEGSINIPLQSLKSMVNKLDKSKPIIVCCASGSRSAIAKRMLKAEGFKDVYNVGTWASLKKF